MGYEIVKNTYIQWDALLEHYDWVRQLILLTGKGTGKSTGIIKWIIKHNKLDTENGGGKASAAWIRNSEVEFEKSIEILFAPFFNWKKWKIDKTGLWFNGKCYIMFVYASRMQTFSGCNLKASVIVWDEFISDDRTQRLII